MPGFSLPSMVLMCSSGTGGCGLLFRIGDQQRIRRDWPPLFAAAHALRNYQWTYAYLSRVRQASPLRRDCNMLIAWSHAVLDLSTCVEGESSSFSQPPHSLLLVSLCAGRLLWTQSKPSSPGSTVRRLLHRGLSEITIVLTSQSTVLGVYSGAYSLMLGLAGKWLVYTASGGVAQEPDSSAQSRILPALQRERLSQLLSLLLFLCLFVTLGLSPFSH